MPNWFERRTPSPTNPADRNSNSSNAANPAPEGAFVKCVKCHHILVTKDFERDLKVCSRCGHHHPLTADERIAITVDADSFTEQNTDIAASDPLAFPDYAAKIASGEKATGRHDTLVSGVATINGKPIVLLVADFRFVGGSMGSVFGEKFARAGDTALARQIPLVAFCASGGARMQEGLFGLMQMAKTSATVAHLGRAGVPYIAVLTDPTMGGALASFASLGDVIFAEPGARVAFAGSRVAQQAAQQTQKLPANYQTAEFHHEHGMVDRIVPRKEMQTTLARTVMLLTSMKGGR